MKLIDLAIKYNFTCYWCHKKFRIEELSRDHINPIRKKHRNESTKTGDRFVLACKCCNISRGSIPFFIYKQLTQ